MEPLAKDSHTPNQLSVPGSFFNQFVTDIQARFACLPCAAYGHFVSAESPICLLHVSIANKLFIISI